MKNSFSKSERLKSTRGIEELYKYGKSFRIYPLKITFFECERSKNSPVSVLISAPKHFFKHAHDRNLVKRRIREAYRINKHAIWQTCVAGNHFLYISFQYANKKIEDYSIIEQSVIQALNIIEKQLINITKPVKPE